MTTDFRALCAELVEELEDWIVCDDESEIADAHSLIDRARALLAQPEGEVADTHYERELQDAEGGWQAGGSANNLNDVRREGAWYLRIYAQDGPHKLIIRHHTTQTIDEVTNG